jgi:antitoxin component of RelBE/YafQ-DinJ toxin-antitoxin module
MATANTINTGSLPLDVKIISETVAADNAIIGSFPFETTLKATIQVPATATDFGTIPIDLTMAPKAEAVANTNTGLLPFDVSIPIANQIPAKATNVERMPIDLSIAPKAEAMPYIETGFFHFIKLPGEVRNKIYRLVLVVDHPLKITNLPPCEYEAEHTSGSIKLRTEYIPWAALATGWKAFMLR